MRFVTWLLRTILAVDTAIGAIAVSFVLPFLVIGCLLAGQYLAAFTFVATGLIGGIIYGRYWRRYPLGKFPAN